MDLSVKTLLTQLVSRLREEYKHDNASMIRAAAQYYPWKRLVHTLVETRKQIKIYKQIGLLTL